MFSDPKTMEGHSLGAPMLEKYLTFFYSFADIPGKPTNLEIDDWDVDRVDLKWAAPKNDGGAPISGYVIERKEKLHSSWDEVLTTSVLKFLFVLI